MRSFGGVKRIVMLLIVIPFVVCILFSLMNEQSSHHQYAVVFEEDDIGNYEEKWGCAENNEKYYIMELQFMTQYSYPTDVLFAGDSITYRCQWNEIFPELSIKNRGIPSDTTEGLMARVDSIVKTQPRKVFIMIGINDLALNVPEKEILDNYCKIISGLLVVPDIEIYVQSILPVSENEGISKADIVNINEYIKNICLEQGVNYIDLYAAFANDDGWLEEKYSIDGVHINAKGYECWKNNIEEYVY